MCCSRNGTAPAWGNNKALELYPGLGNYHHPITTKNPEAQTYFNQGLTLLYGFNHDEAARYFRRAAELDPEAAMPYWGLALSIGPNYNDTAVDEDRAKATYDAVQKAVERAPKASAREQDYIRAWRSVTRRRTRSQTGSSFTSTTAMPCVR